MSSLKHLELPLNLPLAFPTYTPQTEPQTETVECETSRITNNTEIKLTEINTLGYTTLERTMLFQYLLQSETTTVQAVAEAVARWHTRRSVNY